MNSPIPIVVLLLCLVSSRAAMAQERREGNLAAENEKQLGEVVERVVATVNGELLLLSDLRSRAAPVLAALFSSGETADRMAKVKKLYKDILERLIEDMLIAQAAQRLGVRVSQEEMDRAVADVRTRNNMSETEFWEAVRSQGIAESQYRDDIRKQLLRYRVLNQRVRSRVNITENDVRRVYNQGLRRESRSFRYQVSHVFFEVAEGATPAELVRVRELAEDVERRFAEKSFSEWVEEYDGGDLGWLNRGDLPSSLEDPLLVLKPGERSAVVRGPSGFHILKLEAREKTSGMNTFEEQKQSIYQGLLEKALAEQEKMFLRELRSKAVIERKL